MLYRSDALVIGQTGRFERKPATVRYLDTASSRPATAAALAIPDLAALILSAYCSGIRIDFHPPA